MPRQPAESIIRTAKGGCSRLLGTGHFHIDLYGNYTPPGCVGLTVRRDDLGQPLAPESYPIFHALLERGVAGLYEVAQGLGYAATREFAGECDLCADLRGFLVTQAPERFPELAPTEFYTIDR
jgi:hypothetical protein